MRIVKLLLPMLLVATLAFAQYGTTGGGTIPFVHSLSLTWADNSNMLTGVDGDDYNTGYITIPDFLILGNYNANGPSTISAAITGWTQLPPDYSGNKATVDANSDFYFRAVNQSLTDLLILPAFTSFVELTSTPAAMLRNPISGCESESFSLDARVDLDWIDDIPGDYTATLQLTVSEFSPD